MGSNTSGQSSGTTINWTELPDDLERRLAASKYLIDIGFHSGTIEDQAYRLTVALAEARKANKDLWDAMGAEVSRYRERWTRERFISNDLADENAELAEGNELLLLENDQLTSALITAQERLDNALAWCDDVSPHINWNLLTGDDT